MASLNSKTEPNQCICQSATGLHPARARWRLEPLSHRSSTPSDHKQDPHSPSRQRNMTRELGATLVWPPGTPREWHEGRPGHASRKSAYASPTKECRLSVVGAAVAIPDFCDNSPVPSTSRSRVEDCIVTPNRANADTRVSVPFYTRGGRDSCADHDSHIALVFCFVQCAPEPDVPRHHRTMSTGPTIQPQYVSEQIARPRESLPQHLPGSSNNSSALSVPQVRVGCVMGYSPLFSNQNS